MSLKFSLLLSLLSLILATSLALALPQYDSYSEASDDGEPSDDTGAYDNQPILEQETGAYDNQPIIVQETGSYDNQPMIVEVQETEQSEIPEVPEVPEIPVAPGIPGIPVAPGISETPEDLDTPETPENPSAPGTQSLCENGRFKPISIYDRKTAKCYPQRTQGPCSKYALWWPGTEGSDYGICKCISHEDYCKGKFNRPIAISKKDHKCYPLYEQGICGENEWFTVDENGEGICATNPCHGLSGSEVSPKKLTDVRRYLSDTYDGKVSDRSINEDEPKGVHPWEINKPIWYLHEGKCYRTFTQGHCAHANETALFSGTQPTPVCDVIRHSPITGEAFPMTCVHAGLVASGLPPCPKGYSRKSSSSDCKLFYRGPQIEGE